MVHILSSDPEIDVVGTVTDGNLALEATKRLMPHVITMDVSMPNMDGHTATRRIMETVPTPIVMVTASFEPNEVSKTFKALEAGATIVLPKPTGIGHADYERDKNELIRTVKMMSEVKVITRKSFLHKGRTTKPVSSSLGNSQKIKFVAIGASTGGPVAIHTILSALAIDFSLPIVVVQHLTNGFDQGLVQWLSDSTGFSVTLAMHGARLCAGHVYLCPTDCHLKVSRTGHVILTKEPREHGVRPSASYLFRSIAETFGSETIGVLLSGMGKDGAESLRLLRDKGAITMAQNEQSCVVFGMPGEAVKLKAAKYVMSPQDIANMLTQISIKVGVRF